MKKENIINKIVINITIKDVILFLIPFVIFLIVLFSYWPGIMTYDGNYQWNQIQSGYISDAHPFLSTFIPLTLSKTWNEKTVVQIFQILLFSLIWTCICKNFRKNNNGELDNKMSKKKFLIEVVYTVILVLMPIIFVYAVTFWKDIIYSYMLMLLILMIYVGIKKSFKYSIGNLAILALNLVTIQFYRHNGLVVAAIMIPTFLIIFLKKKIGEKKIISFILGVIICEALVIIPKSLIVKPSVDIMETKEGLTLFMTGSLLQAEVPMDKKDIEYLDSLMPIEEWKRLHTPYLINPVPQSLLLNKERVNESFDTLFDIFIKYSVENPEVLLLHYIKADALLWSPFNMGYVYIFDFHNNGDLDGYNFDEKVNTRFEFGKKICDTLVGITLKNDVVKTIFYRPATAMYIAIFIAWLMVKRQKDKRYYMLLLPMLLNLLSLVPVNLAQDLRYVYINYLSLAVILLLYIMKLVEKDKTDIKLLEEEKDFEK